MVCVRIENLDGFRQAHGVEAGTALVREMARTLKDLVRRSDALGRWSGDRFWECSRDAGSNLCKELPSGWKRSEAASPFPGGDRLSLKVSVRTTLAEKGDTAESIQERFNAAGELAATGVKSGGA